MNALGESQASAEMMAGTALRCVRSCCSAGSDASERRPYRKMARNLEWYVYRVARR
jgi:hypothetical protein